MSFFQDLEASTLGDRSELYRVRQLVDGLHGRIGLPTYLAYLGEAYHHVSQTAPLLTLARDGLGDRRNFFRDAFGDYIAEEQGHEQWILHDIAASGGDAEAVRRSAPAPATERMVSFARDYIARTNPMGMFGMIYVLESVSVALASAGAAAVAGALRLGPESFTYLSSHGALDKEHMAFFASLMDRVEDPVDQAAIIEVAQRVFQLFADMFRAIPHGTEAANAV